MVYDIDLNPGTYNLISFNYCNLDVYQPTQVWYLWLKSASKQKQGRRHGIQMLLLWCLGKTLHTFGDWTEKRPEKTTQCFHTHALLLIQFTYNKCKRINVRVVPLEDCPSLFRSLYPNPEGILNSFFCGR